MKTTICLCFLAGLAVCGCEGDSGSWQEGPCEIGFSGSVETRAADNTNEPKPLTDTYGIVHIRHTREGSYSVGDYKDADVDMTFTTNGGMLNPAPAGYWYWDGQTEHIFHAWTEPDTGTDGQGTGNTESLVGEDNENSLRWVDLSMDNDAKNYSQVEGDTVRYRLSNLEYFIGAAKGPVNLQENGGTVTLNFKHLVAKIVVLDIRYVDPDGIPKTLGDDEPVPFNMPHMPNRAYWTTGVPEAGVMPHLYGGLEDENDKKVYNDDFRGNEENYGVSGTLYKGTCFYIYPCRFKGNDEFCEIEFKYGGKWYYGTLASLTGVDVLNAGDCISLSLLLKAGEVRGLYPHIVDWGSDEKSAPSHDKPGIYSETDWQRYVDWVLECQEADAAGKTRPEPPVGLFDEQGNLNLYCDLDLRNLANKYLSLSGVNKLLFPDGDGQLNGNGHRIKVKDGTNWNSNVTEKMDDVYVGKTEYNIGE